MTLEVIIRITFIIVDLFLVSFSDSRLVRALCGVAAVLLAYTLGAVTTISIGG